MDLQYVTDFRSSSKNESKQRQPTRFLPMPTIEQVSRLLVPVVQYSSARRTIRTTMIPRPVATKHGAQMTTSNTNTHINNRRTQASVSRVESTGLYLVEAVVVVAPTVLRKHTIIWDTPKISSRLIREGWGCGTTKGRRARRCGDETAHDFWGIGGFGL